MFGGIQSKVELELTSHGNRTIIGIVPMTTPHAIPMDSMDFVYKHSFESMNFNRALDIQHL